MAFVNRTDQVLEAFWNKLQANDGDHWANEFKQVYANFRHSFIADVGDVKISVVRRAASPTWPWFLLNNGSGTINSAYDSTADQMSGWPDLVSTLQEQPVMFVDGTAFTMTVREISKAANSSAIVFELARDINALSLLVPAMRDHVAATGTNLHFRVSRLLSSAEIPGLRTASYNPTVYQEMTINDDVGLTQSITNDVDFLRNQPAFTHTFTTNHRTITFYPYATRNPLLVNHFTWGGLAPHGIGSEAGRGSLFPFNLARQDHTQPMISTAGLTGLHTYATGNRQNRSVTTSAMQPSLREDFVTAFDANFREGSFTHSPGMGVYYYMFGGEKLDS